MTDLEHAVAGCYTGASPDPKGTCVVCGQRGVVCCDDCINNDGTHDNPVCDGCCKHNKVLFFTMANGYNRSLQVNSQP